MVGGDLCGSPIIPNAPCRRGLRPLVPRGRRGKGGGAGREVSGGVSFPSPVQLLPSGRRFIHLAGAAARGQGSGAGAGAAGQRPPVQRREGPRGEDARPSLPLLPASAAPRLGPRAGLGFPQSWAAPASELPRGFHATARVSGPGRSFHTHTPVLTLLPSLQPWQPRSPGPFLRGARHPRGLRRPFPGARLGAGRAREPGAGRGRRWGSVWLPPPLE